MRAGPCSKGQETHKVFLIFFKIWKLKVLHQGQGNKKVFDFPKSWTFESFHLKVFLTFREVFSPPFSQQKNRWRKFKERDARGIEVLLLHLLRFIIIITITTRCWSPPPSSSWWPATCPPPWPSTSPTPTCPRWGDREKESQALINLQKLSRWLKV